MRALAVVIATLLSVATAGCAADPKKPKPPEPHCRPTAKTISYRAITCDGVLLGDRCYTWTIGMECPL